MPQVRVMRSHDYCQFEIQLEVDDESGVDDARKRIERLLNKACDQYDTAKRERAGLGRSDRPELERKVQAIKENFPKSQWTPIQKATVKALEDIGHYDYQDDWFDQDDDRPF